MIALLGAIVLGLLGDPGDTQKPQPAVLKELLPGVRVGEGIVEFGGAVCADLSHPQTPVVYLELLVTGPDSREHESLVVTTVKASAIHAGLLAAGFGAGHPVRAGDDGAMEPAAGDPVRVQVRVAEDGAFVDLASMAVHAESGTRLTDAEGWGLVFAGSLVDGRGYAADHTGTIVGLAGFGTEIIGAAWTLSHKATIDEPVWIVDADRVPAFGTAVTVRFTRSDKDAPTGDDGAASVGDDPDAGGT